MKALISLIIFVAIALVLMEDSSAAEPKQPTQVTTPAVDSVNYPNYWDAKAWDREGGASFWHAGEQNGSKTAAKPAKPARKGLFARK